MKVKAIWFLVSVVAIVGLLVGTFGCAGTTPAAPQPQAPKEETVKIGGLYELTGFLSILGQQESQAVRLALEQANYQVAGKKIVYIEEDTACDVNVTMDKTRKLIQTDKVGVIIGPTWGPSAQAMAPYLQQTLVPDVAISGHLLELAPFRSVWLTTGFCYGQTIATGYYAYDDLGYRTMALLAQDWSAADQYMMGCADGFAKRGGKIVQYQKFPIGTVDFTPYIANIADADVLACTIIGDDAFAGFKQLYQQGVWNRMPIISSSDVGLFEPPVLAEIGDAAIGIVAEAHYRWGAPTVGNPEFVAAYEQMWGVLPGGYAGMAYAATQVTLAAIEKTSGDMSYAALSKALDETDMDTVRGHVRFNAQRVGITEARIDKIVGRLGNDFEIEPLARYIVTPTLVGGEQWEFDVEKASY
jgi:branched-chain amino acid transport system substrate-binding protein